MSERGSRKLRGPYALFLKGQRADEPLMVGSNAVWLLTAGDRIWGEGSCFTELWSTATDRKYALEKLTESRLFPVRG